MSSFTCFICNANILEDENGNYITGCPHNPMPAEKPSACTMPGWIKHLFGEFKDDK